MSVLDNLVLFAGKVIRKNQAIFIIKLKLSIYARLIYYN